MSDQNTNQLPPVNFISHVLMLAMTAKQFMGSVKIEGQEDTPANFPMARFYIDTILMLKEKTQGSLTSEETSFLEQTISDLQLEYVRVSQ